MRTGPVLQSSWPDTLIHRVAQVASDNGGDIAIEDGHGCSITYKQMLDRVMEIAYALLELHLDDNTAVAVFQDRTADCICSILAIMYAGMVYVPIDADPDSSARSATIVKDCLPSVLLADDSTLGSENRLGLPEQTVVVNVSETRPRHLLRETPSIRAKASAPAAILYTSGTTGTPKGVLIAHRNLANEIEFSAATYGLRKEKVLQQSSLSFDMSLTQIFSALTQGGTLYVVPAYMRADGASLAKLIDEARITMTGATPSEYLAWIAHGSAELRRSGVWKTAICGGEPMTEGLVKGFASLGKAPCELKLFNAFGPTEATCSSNRREVDYATPGALSYPLTVGWTAPNARIYILEPGLEPERPLQHALPVGWAGEIVIGGAGIALGYNNTASSPKFAPDILGGGKEMHKTGDLGRLLPDGQLLVLGRTHGDAQIKMNGVRMSPYEIESAILQSGNGRITEAVVTKKRFNGPDNGDTPISEALVAHIVLHPDVESIPTGTHVALENIEGVDPLRLPRAMRPSLILAVPELPKNTTGKIDRNAVSSLPLPKGFCNIQHESALADRHRSLSQTNQGIKMMAGLWAQVIPGDVLSNHVLTEDSDFFNVGGSSLLLVELRELIEKEASVRLRLDYMFGASTLQGMAELIQLARLVVETATQKVFSDQIDWDHETTPLLPGTDDHECDLTNVAAECPKEQHPRIIILTGATGQLGRAILKKLSDSHSVSEIHCLAVRDPSKLLDDPKIHSHSGDLREPHLGMDPAHADRIFASVDTIIHNGAEVNFLKPYRALQPANVESTREILRLALRSRSKDERIAFHYISSAAVSLCAGCDPFGEVSVRMSTPDALDGYSQTKWASEVMLERAAGVVQNLQTTIHRPSHITDGHDSDGSPSHVGSPDLLDGLLDHCRVIGAVPKLGRVKGAINLVTRNDCASSIVGYINAQAEETAVAKLKFLHHLGGENICLGDMNGHFARTGGGAVDEIPLDEWIRRAEAAGLRKDFAAYLQDVEHGNHTYHYPVLEKEDYV